MDKILLEKTYNFKDVEEKWYADWLEKGLFKADAGSDKPPFVMVIPPPNVTGYLHIGHALNNTLQDILARWKRMSGFNTLWVPGTDHAGIATQNVIEKQLAAKGLSRWDVGREKFIELVWEWKENAGGTIISQLKRLGASCDWSRERFTMDEGLSKAVREVFIRLYNEKLIYRDKYLINWCPRCHTALSDIEVEHEEKKGHLFYVKYPLAGCPGDFVTIATTRPETMLADTAVAVNPEDERYSKYIGKKVILPLMNREVPVIADTRVDKEFGTGALKITPAHDPLDFEIGNTHGLEKINILTDSGLLNENAGPYEGLTVNKARAKVIEDLETLGLLIKTEDHVHKVGHCYRCRHTVEPYISLQWFVRMKELASPAIQAVRDGRIKFVPENWEKTYFEWMNNIRDWCISRQIWWGHRIPVYYCVPCGEAVAAMETPAKCPACGGTEFKQDEDVLDTWFSSALWPFSTLGWPDKTADLAAFYPTTVLSTAFDIIFFWVARMIMMGIKFMDEVPFKTVYIHALIRDIEGQKMSKSRGNVIDPISVIDKYGTDSLRFTLAILAAQGRDILLSEERIEGYRHFTNKLWNSSRFIFMNLDPEYIRLTDSNISEYAASLLPEDKWIIGRVNALSAQVDKSLSEFYFNDASQALYDFVWREFCDWHIEFAKEHTNTDRQKLSGGVLIYVLKKVLLLLHPFMPFITEEIWQKIPGASGSIMTENWPLPAPGLEFSAESGEIELIKEIIYAVRNLRGETFIPTGMKISVKINSADEKTADIVSRHVNKIKFLARIENAELSAGGIEEKKKNTAAVFTDRWQVLIPLEGCINAADEVARVEKELKKTEELLLSAGKGLDNEDFLKKAPEQVVAKKRENFEALRVKKEELLRSLAQFRSISS